VEYELTPGGEALARPVEAPAPWAHDWLPAADEGTESAPRTPRAWCGAGCGRFGGRLRRVRGEGAARVFRGTVHRT